MSDSRYDELEDSVPNWRRRILIVVIVIGVLVGGIWFELGYERGVVSRTVVTGTVTKVNNGAVSFSQAIPGVAPSQAQTAQQSSVVISVLNGSVSFTQSLYCGSPPTRVGATVNVDINVLRSGAHQYVADLACKGTPSPFVPVGPTTTTTTTSHSTA